MKTVRDIMIGLIITLLIYGIVHSGEIKTELYSILKLAGCEGGCSDEQIEYYNSLPRYEIDGDAILFSKNKRLIYLVTLVDSNKMELGNILNLEGK